MSIVGTQNKKKQNTSWSRNCTKKHSFQVQWCPRVHNKKRGDYHREKAVKIKKLYTKKRGLDKNATVCYGDLTTIQLRNEKKSHMHIPKCVCVCVCVL